MTFAALEFVGGFLPLVVLGHLLVRRWLPAMAGPWLLLASAVFYGLTAPTFLPLLAASIAGNHLIATRLAATEGRTRTRWLQLGLVANLGALAVFKYAGFALANLAAITGVEITPPQLGFPLGISFFTLQQVVFLVDCAERLTTPTRLRDHALFLSFFPYVTSGPIVRHKDVRTALAGGTDAGPTDDDLACGAFRFALGLGKKAILADNLAVIADAGFGYAGPLSTGDAWVTAVAFTLQLYFDFSGYTDMAIGAGRMLGWKLPENFDSPLKATTVIDFWRRWHITLSNLITTYLYTPLVRLRARPTFAWGMAMTIVAMTIAGLWHGPAWTYVAFGAAHGVGLVVNQVWKKRKRKMPRPLAWALTFAFVNAAFVLFRAPDLHAAGAVLRAMVVPRPSGLLAPFATFGLIDRARLVVIVLAALAICFGATNTSKRLARFEPTRRTLALFVAVALLALLFANGVTTRGFLYRDF